MKTALDQRELTTPTLDAVVVLPPATLRPVASNADTVNVVPTSTSDPADEGDFDRSSPRLWGFTIAQLHDRFWQSRGIQVVRCRADASVDLAADLYLLAEDDALAIFNPAMVADRLYWNRASLIRLRLHDRRRRAYDERIVLDGQGRFVEIRRMYDRLESRLVRFGITADAKVAQAWIECAPEARSANDHKPWRKLLRSIDGQTRAAASVPGSCYFDDDAADRAGFVRHLVQIWRTPDATIPGLCQRGGTAWAHEHCPKSSSTRFVGPVWLGRGRGMDEPPLVVGPGVMWDEPGTADEVERAGEESSNSTVDWGSIPPSIMVARTPRGQRPRRQRVAKRLFDFAFAIVGLLLTLPLYPLIMLAIWLEDGGPFFFGHVREKLFGTEFRCWKFRSMYRDAESRKLELVAQNEADGPQFYITNDPRVTRVGRFLRRTNLDELPQFWNVLRGDMSVVGPRPSPRRENQFCPAWRDARLSVRPGVTGLWQVCRSRKGGNDFQEWIKYDLDYVRRSSLLLDLTIIGRSVQICLRGERRSS